MPLDLSATLAELVAIPSVNPMGRNVSGDEFFEHRVTAYLEQLFQSRGLRHERQPVAPLRDNILVRVDGDVPPERGGPLLLWEAHQDTVPVEGMTIDPWRPVREAGRLYGRGSCDIKGGLTAMLGALVRLAEERPQNRATVVLACTVNEEHGYTGATALTQLWRSTGGVIPRPPDAAIVAEPTLLDVVVAHKGAVRWRIHTRGRAAHSSQPEQGASAIYRMGEVLRLLEDYARVELATRAAHPRCGGPSFSVGLISGGISVNTVPDRCTIEVDRRVAPGEDVAGAYDDVVRYLAARLPPEIEVEHESPFLQGRPLADCDNVPLGQRLLETVRRQTGGGRLAGVPFGTDAATIAAAGVPAVVFGPGSIAQAHTADEWVELAQVEQAAEILFAFAAGGG